MKKAWPSEPLGELCDVQIGKTPTRSEARFWGDDHPWLSISDMSQGRHLRATSECVTDTAVDELNLRLVLPGTVLLSFKLSIGKVGITCAPMYTNEAIAHLPIVDDRIERDYLYWTLRTIPLTRGADRAAMGATLNKAKLKQIPIPLPPVGEQRRIAAVLDAADGLRAKRRQALAKLDTLAQAIFIDMFGSPGVNPNGYDVAPMIELVDRERPITYGILKPGEDVPGGVPYVRVVDMVDGSIDAEGLRHTTPEISAQYKRSILRDGDLLLSIRGHVGRLAMVNSDVSGANITQDTARLAIAGAEPAYVLECLRSVEIQRWMMVFTKGAAVRGINLTDVKKIPIPLPPRAEQERFARLVARLSKKRAAHRSSDAQLDTLFASLQQRAFRSEL